MRLLSEPGLAAESEDYQAVDSAAVPALDNAGRDRVQRLSGSKIGSENKFLTSENTF
jgi:hypothetical protein